MVPMFRTIDDQCRVDSPVDDRQSLMLFVPADDRGQGLEDRVVQGQDSFESCIAPYRLDSVNEKLLNILGTLPFHEGGGGRTETRRLQSESEAPEFVESFTEYQLGDQFAGGGFGDIWRAQKRTSILLFNMRYLTSLLLENNKEEAGFILKRLKSERGEDGFLSGLREAYFGSLFQQQPLEENNHIVRPLCLH